MVKMNRRNFLASATATASAMAVMSPWSRALGANDEIRVVVAGVNGIGKTHIAGFPKIAGVKLVGLCDVDSAVLGQEAEKLSKIQGPVKTYEDLRKVYDDPNVDVVVLAVPNHWHGLGTVWGCQAGKDIYVEKPCSHNIWEAGQMLKAAEKYKRIVQVGIQRRSNPHLQKFFKEVHEGALGELKSVRALYLSRRESIGKPTSKPKPPSTVNHDLWSGPASTELERMKYHYDWHWFWDTGNAELGNNGPHMLDLARWAINSDQMPTQITSVGGRFVWDDNGETPNTHTIRYDFDNAAPVIFEIRDLPSAKGKRDTTNYRGISYGVVIEGTEGSYVGFDQGTVFDPDGNKVREIKGSNGGDGGRQYHRENFVKALRARNADLLNCTIQQGHLSSGLCHLGNISHRLGETVPVAELADRVQEDALLHDSCVRMTDHLAANGVSVGSTPIFLGQSLKMNPESEKFVQNSAADQLLKREYRAPFIVPENV